MLPRTAVILALVIGSSAALAQAPSLWRDPDHGCTYLLSAQGGIALRYRGDGSPDCAGRAPSRVDALATAPILRPPPPAPLATPVLAAPPPAHLPRAQAAVVAGPAARSFGCQATDGGRENTAVVRVRVEPEAKTIIVDAPEGGSLRFTLDSNSEQWFNGRSERDPRLGIMLSPGHGSMWLDVMASVRSSEVRNQHFQCRPEGAMY